MGSFIQIFLFLSLFMRFSVADCPSWSQQVPGQSDCIVVQNQPRFYKDVIRQCYAFGGIPTKLRNSFESAFIYSLGVDFTQSPYIGVERNASNVWTFADGSALSYQNWAPGEPNTADRANICAVMDLQSQKWIAVDCYTTRPSFCSFDATNNPITTPMPITTTQVVSPCPEGWVYNSNTAFCYYLKNFTYSDGVQWDLVTWFMAEAACQDMGTHLVSSHSQAEDDFLYNLIASNVINQTRAAPNNSPCTYQSPWIGYSGNGTLGTGFWSDGTPVDYIETNYGDRRDYDWTMSNDASCMEKSWNRGADFTARYICKLDPRPPTSPPGVHCPVGWVYNAKTGYCYYLQNFTYSDGQHWDLYNRQKSEELCQGMGSHLVSIHNKWEADFVNNLILSNVANYANVAPTNKSCAYQWVWIGYYGNGNVGNGNWTDGTRVDYIGYKDSSLDDPAEWLISNDPSCNLKQWTALFTWTPPAFARFVCKMTLKWEHLGGKNDGENN